MTALDADGNGEISAKEIENAVAALKKLDKNGDGKLSGEEIRPDFGGRRPGFGGPPDGDSGPGGRQDRFKQLDKNGDGKLTKDELPEQMQRMLERGDKNKDGFLEGAEFDEAFLFPDNFAGAAFDAENPADEYILAVRAGGRGDVTESNVLWKHATKHTDHIVSPFVRDGRMLLVKGGGITTQFDTSTGESLGKPKRIPNASQYFASPIYGDGKIFIAGDNGRIVVLDNDADYAVLAKNDMQESIVGTPAISDGRLIVRTRTKLYSIGNNQPDDSE